MQSPVEPPRELLTAATVTGLIRDTAGVEFGYGCELTDLSFDVIEDITGDVLSGEVSRHAYDTLHGSGSMRISREIPFGYAVLRPWCKLFDGETTARFNLGAYFTSTPPRDLAESPGTYDVKLKDILDALNVQVGDAFTLAGGTPILGAVEDILLGQNVVGYIIDQQAASLTLPGDRSWPFEDGVTWLSIVNDLLETIGYQGIWTDWHGRFRCEKYISPRDRVPEWVYDTDLQTSMIAPDRSEEFDYEDAPNSWVFVRSGGIDTDPPEEGDGIYRFTNERDGPTSVEARRRTILRRVMVDAPDHDSLVASAQRTIDADRTVPLRYKVSTFPNPLHWHFDVLDLRDVARGPDVKALGTHWTLPLDGSDMTHEWTLLV